MNRLLVLVSLCLIVMFVSCQKDINDIGGSIQPDEDIVKVLVDTFLVDARTFEADSIYSKHPSGLLGVFDDPVFGELTSDYMAQFYLPEDFYFSPTIVDDRIDSVMLRLYYSSFTGDSLNPMEVSIYELEKKLDGNHYTNIDPSSYCSMNKLLGKASYSARNYSISDSAFNAANDYPYVEIRMPLNLSERVLKGDVPQVYITNSFGRGTVLNIDYTDLVFFFKYRRTYTDVSGNDSVVVLNGNRTLSVTKEVLQMNRVKNDFPLDFTNPNDTTTYLRTPAGLFTEIVFPIDQVRKSLQGKTINAVKFNLPCYRPYASKFVSAPPNYLLMVQKSKMHEFFRTKTKHDNMTTFIAKLDSVRGPVGSGFNYQYNFSNISRYFENLFKDGTLEDGVHVAIIPIYAEMEQDANGTFTIKRIRNMLTPSSVQLKKGTVRGKVSVVYTEF